MTTEELEAARRLCEKIMRRNASVTSRYTFSINSGEGLALCNAVHEMSDEIEQLRRLPETMWNERQWRADFGKLTAERDAALAEVERLRALIARAEPDRYGEHTFVGYECDCALCGQGSQHYLHLDRDKSEEQP